MTPRRTARALEAAAAAARARPPAPAPPAGEVAAMLARRGLRVAPGRPDLPFPPDLAGAAAAALAAELRHYGFRLFLRGAIRDGAGFTPAQTTRYLTPAQARACAEALVALGLARRLPRGRYALSHPARTFGGTLEWYVAWELRETLGFETARGLKLRVPGVGGDLDVVAAAEGKLVYLELKSAPPKELSRGEVAAFLQRVRALRPEVAILAMDTALRLGDKVLPLLTAELPGAPPRRLGRDQWALTPHLYAVNAKPDLIANVSRAIAAGFLARGPELP
ncbi:MAG TPA: hypothetical protein VGQ83_31715 [Polyangia bacterium]|jgi:hypothetical protein